MLTVDKSQFIQHLFVSGNQDVLLLPLLFMLSFGRHPAGMQELSLVSDITGGLKVGTKKQDVSGSNLTID